MTRVCFLALLMTLAGCRPGSPAPSPAPPPTAAQARAAAAIADLDAMRSTLAQGIAADEAVDAATFARVCKPVGQQAQALAAETGWEVRQLATRYRNPANAADTVAAAAIARFEAEPARDSLWLRVEHAEAFDGAPAWRYLRRITVEPACLACHGARDARPAFVVEGYPDDRAHGFAVGDVRGVYSVLLPDILLSDSSAAVQPATDLSSPLSPSVRMSLFDFFRRSVAPTGLSPRDFLERRTPDAPVLDVRTPQEYAQGHLQGAINVDMMADDFRQQVEALGLDPDAPVYLYCRSGNRSGQAQRQLAQMGFAEAYNVGGFDALIRAGAEAER